MSAKSSRILVWLGSTCLLVCASASAETCKYVDKDGRTIYSNVPVKNARKVSCFQLPPPVSSETSDQGSPQPATNTAPRSDGTSPRVPASAQRPHDRRQSVEEALAREQEALGEAKRALAQQVRMHGGNERPDLGTEERLKPYQDAVTLHEKNLKSLSEELAKLK